MTGVCRYFRRGGKPECIRHGDRCKGADHCWHYEEDCFEIQQPEQYRKKPVVIEAMQWKGDLRSAMDIWRWMKKHEADGGFCLGEGKYGEVTLKIATLEGKMQVSPFDYVICGVNDEFYPCKPEIFGKTYEGVH